MTDDYKVSPPDHVGTIPPRIEIPVDKSTKKIGWSCREYSGGAVYRLDGAEQPTGDTLDAFKVPERLLPRDTPLEPGQRLLCPTLFGYGIGVVDKDGHVTSPSGQTLYMVRPADDDRACWVCDGSGNLGAVRKLTLNG
jgi:hypothetical protein